MLITLTKNLFVEQYNYLLIPVCSLYIFPLVLPVWKKWEQFEYAAFPQRQDGIFELWPLAYSTSQGLLFFLQKLWGSGGSIRSRNVYNYNDMEGLKFDR